MYVTTTLDTPTHPGPPEAPILRHSRDRAAAPGSDRVNTPDGASLRVTGGHGRNHHGVRPLP
ncbi:hypothetical protein EDD96_6455 [Streptomyces sp. Ag109_G2-6]|nr:hypothetical protein EDD96_6455 [Streptomyces sp. Ag109_G2-6]